MSQMVVGRREGDGWAIEVQGVGTTSATELGDVETAARALLAAEGHEDAETIDLQLLLPDFEVDLDNHGLPGDRRPHLEIVAGIIALAVLVGAVTFVLGLLL